MSYQQYLSPELLNSLLYSAIILIAAFIAIAAVGRGLGMLAKHFHAPGLGGRVVRLVVRYIILITAVAFILGRFGFDMNPVLAVLGTVFGLVAIGFVATWSTLSNFLCSLIIVGSKMFAVGDRIELPTDNISGEVAVIGLIFTTLKDADGALVEVPNNLFFQKIFKWKRG